MTTRRSQERIRPPDTDAIVIAVMGETGAGKSEFIGRVTGKPTHVNDSLTPEARGVIAYPLHLPAMDGRPAREVQLLDCPGFDDGTEPSRKIINAILAYLMQHYQRDKVHGIIYMIDITRPRVSGRTLVSLSIFRALCGVEFYANVVLGTTHWDELRDEATGQARQNELESVPEFWGTLSKRGSQIRQIRRGNHSGPSREDMSIICNIANTYKPKFLLVQEEMQSGLDASQTSPIIELNEWQQFHKQLSRLKRESNGQISQHQSRLKREKDQEVAEMNQTLRDEELRFAGDQARLERREREVQRLMDDMRATNEQRGHANPQASDEELRMLAQEKHELEASLSHHKQHALEKVLRKCKRYGRGKSSKTRISCSGCGHGIDSKRQCFYRKWRQRDDF